MTDGSATFVWKAEYRPFGELFSNTISTKVNDLRLPGQYFDWETGLHQNWFRDYSPKTGRYMEADPIGLAGGVNTFTYTGLNPVNRTDRTGTTWSENPWLIMAWVFEIGGTSGDLLRYGPDSPATMEMRASHSARVMRREFRRGGCQSASEPLFYGTGEGFVDTALDVLSELDHPHPLNGTQAQVGGFSYRFTNNGDGTVTYHISNDLSMFSLFYHLHLEPQDVGMFHTPYLGFQRNYPRGGHVPLMGNLTQQFEWTEPTPCNCNR
jgi:RHS repeat-associated protein